MDSSFLDIFVGWDGAFSPSGISMSSDAFSIKIPDGSYPGQRLNIHLVVAPTMIQFGFPAVSYAWPSLASACIITLTATDWTGASYDIADARATDISTGPPYTGGETYVELMWVDRTYTTAVQGGSFNTYTTRRGWMVVNGVQRDGAITTGRMSNRLSRQFS